MKGELLKYLKSYSDGNLLKYYGGDRNKSNNRELYKSICSELAQISLFIEEYSKKPQVLIVEADPLRFITVFLAGVVAEVDLFLGDPAWQQREWRQVLELVKPDLVYGDRATRDLIAKVRFTIENAAPSRSDLPEQPLIMIPTGGTSGKIRFAMHTWETLAASVTGFKDYFGCQKINSCCTLPVYHVSGLMQLMRSLLTQGELIICSYKTVATKIMFDRSDYFISLVPTQLQFLIKSIPDWLSQFKVVLLGGAPPMRSLLDTAREYNIPVALTYGMTETASGVVALKPQDFLAGNNSSGRVLPHAKVAIEPGDNKLGLIRISGNSLCLGYYPQLFSSELVTDDLGYFDELGYLYLVGRNSQKIITGGENVFPAEVESAIYSTQLVKDICVVGIEDRHWGEVVTAIYVPAEPKTNLESIEQKIQLQLAKYKQPKNWIEVDSLPRNDRGKINYQKIKAIARQTMSFDRDNYTQ